VRLHIGMRGMYYNSYHGWSGCCVINCPELKLNKIISKIVTKMCLVLWCGNIQISFILDGHLVSVTFCGDYRDMLYCVIAGKNPSDAYLDQMMGEAPGPINFTMFLTMFGEKLNGTDPEDVIKNAFACFDENNTGVAYSFCRLLVATV